MKKTLFLTNLILLLIFTGLTVFIFVRQTDGAGIQQNMTLKWVNFIILAVFYGLLILGQLVILGIRKVSHHANRNKG